MPPGNGFLIIEFGGSTQVGAENKAQLLVDSLTTFEGEPSARIYTSSEAKRVWHIRESGLGATAFVPGVGTGWVGWEDAAVDPVRLGSYLRAIFDRDSGSSSSQEKCSLTSNKARI